MKSLKNVISLNDRGIAHYVAPLVVIMLVAIAGTYLLVASHADSVTDPNGSGARTYPVRVEADNFAVATINGNGHQKDGNEFVMAHDPSASLYSAYISTHAKPGRGATSTAVFDQSKLMNKKIIGYDMRLKITNCPNNPIDAVSTNPSYDSMTAEGKPITYTLGSGNHKITLPTAGTSPSYSDYYTALGWDFGLKSYSYTPNPKAPLKIDLVVQYKPGPISTGCISQVSIDTITFKYIR